MNRVSSTLSNPTVSITSIPKVNFAKKRNVEKKEKEERMMGFGFSMIFILVNFFNPSYNLETL